VILFIYLFFISTSRGTPSKFRGTPGYRGTPVGNHCYFCNACSDDDEMSTQCHLGQPDSIMAEVRVKETDCQQSSSLGRLKNQRRDVTNSWNIRFWNVVRLVKEGSG
jgi:hypothetical protein